MSTRAVAAISTSGALVEEVLSTSHSESHVFDWRHYSYQIAFGYSSIQESNTFKSHSWNFEVTTPYNDVWILRGALRNVTTSETDSSQLLSQTPFSQAAQPSRYEAVAGVGYTLLDGRSSTPFSPRLTDVGHALYVLGGLQYNYFTNKDAEPVPAMRAVYYNFVAETGLRLQIFLPKNLGVGLDWTYSFPLRKPDTDLNNWQRFSGNISWSFGD